MMADGTLMLETARMGAQIRRALKTETPIEERQR
jgi:hypothetical protein